MECNKINVRKVLNSDLYYAFHNESKKTQHVVRINEHDYAQIRITEIS